jgi:transposase-like protein
VIEYYQNGGNDMVDYTEKESLKQFLKENDIRDPVQLNMLFRQMTGVLLEELLESERDEHLGYSRAEGRSKQTGNSRNGYSPKTVRSNQGELKLKIPRDRAGEYEPQAVKKHQRDISEIADKIISMYAKGMTVRDIQSHLEDMYEASISAQTISNITDRILPQVEEWRSRQLESIYAIVYIDGHRYRVRTDGRVQDRTVYAVLGIDLSGQKDLLGLWVSGSENAKYWLQVLTDLKNRGVKDILIVTSDDLPGIQDAISAVYPDTEYQGCVVHVIRNSLKYVSYQDRKEFSRSLKSVYKAPTEEAALASLDAVREHWAGEYPLAVGVWDRNWERIRTMFRFTEEIRRLIYTTNPIESYHRQLRKVTKTRSLFPTDTAMLKLLYLATQDVLKKWTMKIRHWNQILAQLSIHFQERVVEYL